MNFLAHQYLSGESDKIKLGNFIGDYVKGRNYQNYHSEVQKGILLHRNIDHFTDHHPIVRNSSKRLRKGYSKYSGVVVDVIYDHFLAKNWNDYHTESISNFINLSHQVLIKNYLILPNRVKLFLPFIIQSRRMESYANIEGLKTALQIMSKHTSLPKESDYAIEILSNEYDEFESEFNLFMKDLINYVSNEHQISVATPCGWHLNEEK